MKAIGILQGRLSPAPAGRAQAFPDSWEDEFTLARSCGFDAIEWLITAASLPANPLLHDDGVGEIREIRARTGVAVDSVGADCFIAMPLVDVADSVRRERIELLTRIVDRSALAGIAVVLLPVLEGNALRSEDEGRSLVDALAAPLAHAERAGVTIALESDWPAASLARLVDGAAHRALGVYYDVGNAAADGRDPAREIDTLSSRIRGVHLKDRCRGGGSLPLGDGDVDFNAVSEQLLRVGFDGPVILETPVGADPVTSARANLAFVRDRMASSRISTR